MHFWGHNIFSFVKSKDSYQSEKQSDIVLMISQSHNKKDDSHGNINLIKNCLFKLWSCSCQREKSKWSMF